MAQSKSPVVKILLIVLLLIILLVLAALGSCVYVAYRAKKKMDEIQQAYKSGELDKVATAVGLGEPKEPSKTSTLSFPASSGTEQHPLPVVEGMTAVSAVAQFGGDYQSILTIRKVTPDTVDLSIRADNVPNPIQGTLGKLAGEKPSQESGTVMATRIVMKEDMLKAHELQEWFSPNHPDAFPGTTAVSVSREVLSELKEKGETSFRFGRGGLQGLLGSLAGPAGQMVEAAGAQKEGRDLAATGKVDCTLKRVGEVAFPVLLNDKRVSLRALHAQCNSEDGMADFYFLDDLENPAVLGFKLGDKGDVVQVISIFYPEERPKPKPVTPTAQPVAAKEPPPQIEKELQEQGKAEVYGIYFDFGSDRIKPESEPVLKEIAVALEHNPSWSLNVEGHTDNVGGEATNMPLSQRRAEAVKRALVKRYGIAEDRLSPQGFGSTRPKESNDTLAGRARNRRVELVRK